MQRLLFLVNLLFIISSHCFSQTSDNAELKTRLHPDGFNAFDSYGECLMKLGQTKKAKAAYQKSLELNHANDHAKNALKDL